MKADNTTTEHNRTIKVSGILDADMPEMLITITYVRETNDANILNKAIALDNLVIPAIIKALNKE